MLEECRLPYNVIPVNIARGDQFTDSFLKISPNNRMPAIVDHDGPGGRPISVFELGAILQYLGRKTGRFYPAERAGRVAVDEWLFWQMANLGPKPARRAISAAMRPRGCPTRIDRYGNELNRLYGVMNSAAEGRIASSPAAIRSPTWLASAGSGRGAPGRDLRGLSASQALARRGAGAARGCARHAYPRRGGRPGRRHRSERARGAVRAAREVKRR